MVLAFVPARGGSKSIPLKNIKILAGKPLIYWNLRALQDCEAVDKVVVATDSGVIAETVRSFEMEKVEIYDRDPLNAQDTSSTESVMIEYIRKSDMHSDDIFMLVQATSPFSKASDFSEAMSIYKNGGYDSLLSVIRVKRFFWSDKCTPLNYDFRMRPRRQDFVGSFMENGAFYLSKVGMILESENRLSGKIGMFEMPEYTGLEIDEPKDWTECEKIFHEVMGRDLIQKKQTKLFITDVDGVLTDAGMYYSENGDELKKFNTTDGMGIQLLRENGIKTAIITSENTAIVKRRAEKMKIDYLFQGVRNKLEITRKLCAELGIEFENVSFVGDDINDLELLSCVGFPACPENAVNLIKSIPGIFLLNRKGGAGAVREFAEIIIRNNAFPEGRG